MQHQRIYFIIMALLVSIYFPVAVQGQEGKSKIPPLDVILLVDESETMWNKTDSEGIRVNTVNYFIDLLRAEQSGANHRVAIIPFGTEPEVIPFSTLKNAEEVGILKAQFETVHKQIEGHKDVEYTDINAALEAALTLIQQESDPSRKAAIILISDGQPTRQGVSEKRGQDIVWAYMEQTQQLLGQLRQHPYKGEVCPDPDGAPLFMIGMGVDKLAESSSPDFIALYREFWQGSSGANNGYYREAERLQDMQGISTYIFSELLCIPAIPSTGIRANQSLAYQVYDEYYQIFFAISSKENTEQKVKIFRPQADGSTSELELEKEAAGVTWQAGADYEIWGINYSEPWTGTWQIILEGEGRAEFSYIFFPNVIISLDEPNSGFLPSDKPFNIQAKLVDENGQIIDIPLKSFKVVIEGEDYQEIIDLEKDGEVFSAQHEALKDVGEYSLTLSATLPDGTPIYEHKFVTLVSAPWAEVIAPSKRANYTPNESIRLQVKVHADGVATFDDIKLISTLFKDGKTVQSIEMSHVSDPGKANSGAYSGTFQAVDEAGAYTIQSKLRAILPGGRVFDHQTVALPISVLLPPTATPTSSLTPTPTSTPTPTPTPTATPTATSKPMAALVSSPTPDPSPTPTPTPLPWYVATTTSPSFGPCLGGLFILLLVLAALGGWWYKRRQIIPDQIKLLAELMRSRQENDEPPYILVIGSGESVTLGSESMKPIIKTIAGSQDMNSFYQTLDNFSPTERQLILSRHFEVAKTSIGYQRLASLAEKGYFKVIFTTNTDPFLDNLLAGDGEETAEFQVILADKQRSAETIALLDSPFPPIKLVKLHGDVQTHSFAFTPSEISNFGSQSEEILRHYLNRDLIIIGPGQRDYDLNRALSREGGSIWYVNQVSPISDTQMSQVVINRSTEMNIITGEFGQFDRFFKVLYKALMQS